eukprot:5202596-Amphidinium_carterae.1
MRVAIVASRTSQRGVEILGGPISRRNGADPNTRPSSVHPHPMAPHQCSSREQETPSHSSKTAANCNITLPKSNHVAASIPRKTDMGLLSAFGGLVCGVVVGLGSIVRVRL